MVQIVGETDDSSIIGDFFSYLYEQHQGYLYIAHKVPGNQHEFKQSFFRWPEDKDRAVQFVIEHRHKYEIYYAPALFSTPSSLKDHVLGARVFWCEFDGRIPVELGDIPAPSLRVVSSVEGHEHWYWKLDQLVDASLLDKVNRSLTYTLGADSSGWDASQILRPPQTFNHKREAPVSIFELQSTVYNPGVFGTIPEPPPLQDIPVPESIPDVQEVVFKHQFPHNVAHLFRVGVPVGKRSEGMMSLGYYLAEMNLTNEEMLAVLLNADQRWGKFSGRQDQLVRLMEIITIARTKYPYRAEGTKVGIHSALQPMGLLTLLRSEIHIEWAWDGWLQKQGYMLLTGPSGIGKTQLSLDVCGSMALGLRALDSPTQQSRIGFFSLEMNLPELKEFLQLMALGFTPEELEILENNLLFLPLGEPLYLNKTETREQVEQFVSDYKLDGVVFDSLGSTTDGDLSNETSVKSLIDWNDRFRQRSGVFTWFIHHHRKASGDNKKPNKLSDVYGNQYLTARASSVVCLWDSGIANTIDFIPLKVRLRANPGRFHIKRGSNLRFTRMVGGIVKEEETPNEDSEELESISLVKPGDGKPGFGI